MWMFCIEDKNNGSLVLANLYEVLSKQVHQKKNTTIQHQVINQSYGEKRRLHENICVTLCLPTQNHHLSCSNTIIKASITHAKFRWKSFCLIKTRYNSNSFHLFSLDSRTFLFVIENPVTWMRWISVKTTKVASK